MKGISETEKDFASWLEELLELFGYRWVHFRPARVKRGSTKTMQPIEESIIADPKLASMVKYYEESISMVTPTIFENLKLLCDEHDEAEFQRAVDQAKGRKVRSPIRYIEKCLENWKKESQPEENPEAEEDWK